MTINAVIVVPDDLVTWSLADDTTPEQIASLDIYMSDFGYMRAF